MSQGDANTNIVFDADTEQKIGIPAIDGMPDFKPVITPELAEQAADMEPRDRKFAIALMGTMSVSSQQILWLMQHIVVLNAVARDLKRENLRRISGWKAVVLSILVTLFAGFTGALFMRALKVL